MPGNLPKYIPPLDDFLARPPYAPDPAGGGKQKEWLYESHGFRLAADSGKLDKLCRDYLVDPFENGKLEFSLAESSDGGWNSLYLTFSRYWSKDDEKRGWTAYTEVSIGFRVRRSDNGNVSLFAPFIYVDDDSNPKCHGVMDPSVTTIMLSRELYGLSKAPGYIEYNDRQGEKRATCMLDILRPDESGRIRPIPAIQIRPTEKKDEREDEGFEGTVPEERLVGLKQFRDPGDVDKACYQAVVESTLESVGKRVVNGLGRLHEITFLDLGSGLDFVETFGIMERDQEERLRPAGQHKEGYKILVPKEDCYTLRGTLVRGKNTEVLRTRSSPYYVQRKEDLIVRPPYYLGYDRHRPVESLYECYGFRLKAAGEKLASLCKKYLVDPLGTAAPVRFSLPENEVPERMRKQGWRWLYVVFHRYQHCSSVKEEERGWMAYTEALIGFRVRRALKGARPSFPWFVPFIYIDGDADTPGARRGLADPAFAPIAIGRELYGLPKNPGYISYGGDADSRTANCQLSVLRVDEAGKARPFPAISIEFDRPSEKLGSPGPFKGDVLENRLVGLKQFREAGRSDRACYQAVVESTIARRTDEVSDELGGIHRVTFHPLDRHLDFVEIFGIMQDEDDNWNVRPLEGRSVEVRRDDCYRLQTKMVFGREADTKTWPTRRREGQS